MFLPIELIYEIVQLNAFQLWKFYISQLNREYVSLFNSVSDLSVLTSNSESFRYMGNYTSICFNWRTRCYIERRREPKFYDICPDIYNINFKRKTIQVTGVNLPKNY